ncbi:RDD family protein [Priestia abyssalis]|uniref:RDD family protein n=1 Tax=Priestia abyssalis TaxID=1221450 RepID=UPI0009956845|nr:RDD family protein [Priestia abyssalis]
MNGHEPYIEETEVQTSIEEKTPREKVYVWYAGFWMRLWAYLLDLVVVMSIQKLLIAPFFRAAGLTSDTGWLSPVNWAMAAVFYLYFILMTKQFSQTIGKMIMGLKVISLTDDCLTWSAVIFRELIGRYISKTALFLGYAVVAFTSKKRGFHDYFAETSVIHEKQPAYLIEKNSAG